MPLRKNTSLCFKNGRVFKSVKVVKDTVIRRGEVFVQGPVQDVGDV